MNLATIIFKVTTKFIEDYRRLITRGTCFYSDKQTEFAIVSKHVLRINLKSYEMFENINLRSKN